MSVELGHFAAILAFALALAQAGLGIFAARRGAGAQAGVSRLAEAAFLLVAVAFASLAAAYIRSDFSVANVAAHSHVAKPLLYKIAGTWGNHEGSMLLWCLIAAGFAACAAWFGGSMSPSLRARAIGVQGAVSALSLGYMLFTSNPFARLNPAPGSGADLNPLLQDPALAFHPPFLYLGYVGLSFAYSLALAGMIEGRTDAAWARQMRPWALAAWIFLSIGIGLGAYWAYYELGWGGWWFWDPVENASFMPWLAALALIHSASAAEKRGALAQSTVLLAITGFCLSILGTFLVRSGAITSVHAFALDPERGLVLLGLMGVAAIAGFGLYAWRSGNNDAPPAPFAIVSRESALIVNNLFLGVAAATVLFGTIYPLILEAVNGGQISVGPPYFNATFAPLMSMAFLALPVAPLLAWKRAALAPILQQLSVLAALCLAIGALTLAAFGAPIWTAIGAGLGAWLVLGTLYELLQRGNWRAGPGVFWRRLRARPASAWGMTLAHIGAGVFLLGATIETGMRLEATISLGIGESAVFYGRDVRLEAVEQGSGPNYALERGTVTIEKDQRVLAQLKPERRFYPVAGMPTSEVGIGNRGFSDLYVALGEPNAGADGVRRWTLRVYWNPLIDLVFWGVGLMALGGLVSLTERRLRIGAPAGRRKSAPASAPVAAE